MLAPTPHVDSLHSVSPSPAFDGLAPLAQTYTRTDIPCNVKSCTYTTACCTVQKKLKQHWFKSLSPRHTKCKQGFAQRRCPSVCLFVCLSVCRAKCVCKMRFSQKPSKRSYMVSIDDQQEVGFSKNPFLDP